jgi:hypothetical protein
LVYLPLDFWKPFTIQLVNIYSKKQRWKLLLFVAAMAIVIASLIYTNTLVNKIAAEERKKVRLWADAIRKKANLVRYTNELFNKIKIEERKKVELWASGTKQLANSNLEMGDLSFLLEVVRNNETVPVILVDKNGAIIDSRNLDPQKQNDPEYLKKEMAEMAALQPPIVIDYYKGQKNYVYYKDSRLFSELKNVLDDLSSSFMSEVAINSASVPVIYTDSSKQQVLGSGNIDTLKMKNIEFVKEKIASMSTQNPPIEIELGDKVKNYIFYQDSFLLTQLKYYPFVQFGVVGIFLLVAYTLFSTSRKAEQNQVWVGMAKETAHQLGTPLSSLIAWIEYLKTKGVDEQTISEVRQDVSRLETITERFSKIGAMPVLQKEDMVKVLEKSVNYIKSRTSKNVHFSINNTSNYPVFAALNVPLFEWVIENICKNAVDAMTGNGSVTIEIADQTQYVYVDITDSGKGIPKSKFKTVFEPGYTTKQRGWGLGLSLSKRIIEIYHNGKIFVKRSEPDKGTTFRIVLNK